MKIKIAGLLFGIGFGFVMAWARLTDPAVIREMLLLREFDVFLLMGSAVVVAAVGVRVLRARGARAVATGELVSWTVEKPQGRHIAGSVLFGAGWCVAGTCPGPVTAMMGEGRFGGIVVAAGLLGGVVLQSAFARRRAETRARSEVPGTAGL
jgi:uncharacterized membrane protein YedE/YeeE